MKSASNRLSGQRSNQKPRLRRHPRGREVRRFPQAKGKTVEFVEVDMSFDFPCVDIGFADKTALHVLLGIAGFTAEPQYSLWKDGNERVLKSWPQISSRRRRREPSSY